MEEYSTEYGHFRPNWKVYRDMLYFIEITGDEKKRLMAYDMASGNVKQIDTGEFEPAQFKIRSDGTIDRLANLNHFTGKWDNLKAIPKGSKIYEDDRIVAVDMESGMVKTYGYNSSCTGELQWDIEVSEDMEFVDFNVEGDGIWGIWKLADKDVYKRAVLK